MNDGGMQTYIKVWCVAFPMKSAPCLMMIGMIFLSISPALAAELVASHGAWLPANGTWLPVSDLKVGDTFLTPDGKRAMVTAVEDVSLDNASCYGFVTYADNQNAAQSPVAITSVPTWVTRLWRQIRSFFQ